MGGKVLEVSIQALRSFALVLVLLLALFPPLAPSISAAPQPPRAATAAQQAQVSRALASSLHLIPNRGQVDAAEVTFIMNGQGGTVYWTSTGLTVALLGPAAEETGERLERSESPLPGHLEPAAPTPRQRWAVKVDFVGANSAARLEALEPTGTIFSYFRGPQAEWHTAIPSYARLAYRDLWPGVDLEFYGEAGALQRRFLLHEGADPAAIRLAYRGAERVEALAGGALCVSTPLGAFIEQPPLILEEGQDGRYATYALAEGVAQVGEWVAALRPGEGLVEAPQGVRGPAQVQGVALVYCGYIGGAGDDYGYGIAVDGVGNAYVTGETFSSEATFPVMGGPDPTYNGRRPGYYSDAFVAKVRADGSGLAYCGYIGGVGQDSGSRIAVDGAGNAYVTGDTGSTEGHTFPVVGGPDLTYNGGNVDTFVAQVRADGSGLAYCGYIGGSDDDAGLGIAVDAAGHAYVTGETRSYESTFPVVVGPDLTHNGGHSDAFVAKVGAAPLYSLSGRVRDAIGTGLAGVTISAGAPYQSITDADGGYMLADLPGGAYTLTPTLRGHVFAPASRVVSVPPNRTDQDFVAVRLLDVTVSGPTLGLPGGTYPFTATVSPFTATLPITYTWQASQQTEVVHSGAGLSDGVAFTWGMVGPQAITVTVANAEWSAQHVHRLVIAAQWWQMPLPLVLKRR